MGMVFNGDICYNWDWDSGHFFIFHIEEEIY
jgi:hypothetical protein